MGAKKARILVACVRRAYSRLFAILSGRELAFVGTLAEARAALKAGGFDLVLIGLHFDESRMSDLLRHIRADRKDDRLPVVCFRGVTAPDAPSQPGLEGVGAACEAQGASAFLDLLAFPDDATGNADLRKTIEDFLAREPDAE